MGHQIAIRLPLPLDVSGALLSAIGGRWPDAAVRTDTPDRDHMVIDLGDTAAGTIAIGDAAAHLDERGAPTAATDDMDARVELFLNTVAAGGIGISAAEWVSRLFCGMFIQMFADEPAAENYIETTMLHPDGGRWTVTVTAPNGRTAHELRRDAEGDRDRWRDLAAGLAAGTIRRVDGDAADEAGTWMRAGDDGAITPLDEDLAAALDGDVAAQ